MRSHLKVKVYTLGAEMTYIRRQEEKWKSKARAARQRQKQNDEKAASAVVYCEDNFWSQREHRKGLKSEARWSHLAYGFMRGRDYQQMEFICYGDVKGYNREAPNWERIEEIITKFSKDEPDQRDIMQRFGEWLAAGKVWYDANPDRIPLVRAAREAVRNENAASEEYQNRRRERNEAAKARVVAATAAGWVKRRGKWRQETGSVSGVSA